MENLLIPLVKKPSAAPYVHFDLQTGVFEIAGESYLESPEEFYAPICQWLQDFKEAHNAEVVFHFRYTYYNSSTARYVLSILKILKEYARKATVTVNWHYTNRDMEEDGRDFEFVAGLPINLVAANNAR